MISVKDGAAIDYTGLKAAKELTVSGTVLTMGADAKANTCLLYTSGSQGGALALITAGFVTCHIT